MFLQIIKKKVKIFELNQHQNKMVMLDLQGIIRVLLAENYEPFLFKQVPLTPEKKNIKKTTLYSSSTVVEQAIW